MSELSVTPESIVLQPSDERLVVIIPAYNEERFIGSVVLKARQFCRQVIVVDDGSTDDTAEIALQAGAQVERHASNQGKGAALNTALRLARQHQPGVVVMLDADGQHAVEDIAQVAAPILLDKADIVIGSRYMSESSQTPRHRVFGHRIFNLLTRLGSGVTASDSQSGYRAFSPRALELLTFRSSGFSVESEMQFLVNQHGLRLAETPVNIKYLDKPKRNVLAHGVMVFNGMLRLVGQYRPLLFFGAPGGLMLATGLVWGWYVVDIYRRHQQLAVGYAMISVLLTILGGVLLSTGFTLHSIRSQLSELSQQIRSKQGKDQ